MTVFFTILFFAAMYAVKGGSGKVAFKNWDRLRKKNKFFERLLDGRIISTILVFVYMMVFTQDLELSVLFAGAWLLSIAPSIGEEHGAIGRYGHSWGEYVQHKQYFGRKYGIKKGIQRGVWIGAIMTLATGYIPFIVFSFLFVPCVFIGQEINYRIYKEDGWFLAEPIIGGIVFGVPAGMYLNTVML